MGFFDKLKKGLEKTHENIFARVDRLINYKSEVDDDFLEQLEEILLSSDVGVQTTEVIIGNLKNRIKEQKFERKDQLNAILKEEIKNVFAGSNVQQTDVFKVINKPHVIVVVGVNGVG